MASPLKQIVDLKREEWPIALPMAAYFFLVITTFWILKPLKKSVFFGYYDERTFDFIGQSFSASQGELFAKLANMLVALVAASLFAQASSKLRREKLSFMFSGLVGLGFVVFYFLLQQKAAGVAWGFYLFGDLYNTVMVVTFFAFMNDSVTSEQAKRLYGIVGLGGVAGGAVGATLLRGFVKSLDRSTWMLICIGITMVIVSLAAFVGRRVSKSKAAAQPAAPKKEEAAKEAKGNAAVKGAKLVVTSKYLLSIVAIVGFYEMVSTIMDFQFSQTVEHFKSGEEQGAYFASVYAVTNWVGLFIQLFLTSFVMRRFGVGIALLALPVAAFSGSAAFLVAPILLFGSALNTVDNAINYSINQSAKEVLYVPTTNEEKYAAKAFIDMFVQRAAKAVAVGLSLLITTFLATEFEGVRYLSLMSLVFLVIWILAVRYVGKTFKRLEEEEGKKVGV